MGRDRIAVLLLWMSCLLTLSFEIKVQDTSKRQNERQKRLIPYMMFYLTGQTPSTAAPYAYTPATAPDVPNKLDNHLIQNYLASTGAQYYFLPQPVLQEQLFRRLPYLVASQQLQEFPQSYEPPVYKTAKPITKERNNLKSLQLFHNPYTGLPLEQYQLFKQNPKVFSVTHFKTLNRPQFDNSETPQRQQIKQYNQSQRPDVKYVLKYVPNYAATYAPTYAPQRDATLSDYAEPEIQKPDVDKLTAEYYSQHKLVNNLPTYQAPKHNVLPTYQAPKHEELPTYQTPKHEVLPTYQAPKDEELPTYEAPKHEELPTYQAPKHEGLPTYQGLPKAPKNGGVQGLAQILQTLQRANALYQPRLPVSMKAIYSYLDKDPDDNSLQSLEEEKESLPAGPAVLPDDDEGGTPGKAGVDYPALSIVPHTKFSCKTQRYKGFFGDPDTNCQVWHYCDLNGGQASFLCPNGTLFSQQALTCDWWFNVRCDATAQLYVLNERLYKYILPMKPSFPEDYSGPEADNYIHLKFQEAEKKRKEKAKNQTAMHENAQKEKEPPQVIDVNKQVTLEDFLTKKSIQIK